MYNSLVLYEQPRHSIADSYGRRSRLRLLLRCRCRSLSLSRARSLSLLSRTRSLLLSLPLSLSLPSPSGSLPLPLLDGCSCCSRPLPVCGAPWCAASSSSCWSNCLAYCRVFCRARPGSAAPGRGFGWGLKPPSSPSPAWLGPSACMMFHRRSTTASGSSPPAAARSCRCIRNTHAADRQKTDMQPVSCITGDWMSLTAHTGRHLGSGTDFAASCCRLNVH